MNTQNWIANYNDTPTAIMPGWQIKEAREPHTPVAAVPVPYGGKESPGYARQQANAALIAASPLLLAALEALLCACEGQRISIAALDQARTAVAKAEGRQS